MKNSPNLMTVLSFTLFFAGLGALGVFATMLYQGVLFELDPAPHSGQVAWATLWLLLILSSVPFSITAHLLGRNRTGR